MILGVLGALGLEFARDFRQAKQRVQTAQTRDLEPSGLELSTELSRLIFVKVCRFVVSRSTETTARSS